MITKNIGIRYGIWAILSGLTTLAYGLQPANATPYYFVDSYSTLTAAQSASINSYFSAMVGSLSYRESFESFTPTNTNVSTIETSRVKINFADNAENLRVYQDGTPDRARFGQSATHGSRYVFLTDGVTSVQDDSTSDRQRDLIIEFKGVRIGQTNNYRYPTGVSFDIRDFADYVDMDLAIAIVDFVDANGNEVASTDYVRLDQYTRLLTDYPRSDGQVDRISIYDDTYRIKRIRLAALGAAGDDAFTLDNFQFFNSRFTDPGPDGKRGTRITVPFASSEPEGLALFPLAAIFYLTRRRALQREVQI